MKFKKLIILALAASGLFGNSAKSQQNYKIQPVSIQSRWAAQVSPVNALREYPRPQMVRLGWTNLNGLWDYGITAKNAGRPANFDGKILVPYPLESALSGVKKSLSPDQNLWYRKMVSFKPAAGMKTILHFGAVDYQATVFVNGKQVGEHKGGYTEFSFDITSALKAGNNELVVKVYDPTNAGFQPHGKQVLNPGNIYYTPTSGIWQTVWMESVPVEYVEGLSITPDIDKGIVNITVKGGSATVRVLDGGKEVASARTAGPANDVTIKIPNVKLWSPGNPFLYDLEVTVGKDKVKSYFGMRKISVAKDSKGVDRIMLNNKPYYNLGTLDQGFWPDGLYTAPTDEALAFDIKAIKAMGFNTIRKHIKVEPARWYYHADKIGMLVWQDMVNPNQKQPVPVEAQEAFEQQSKETMTQLHNYPSIVTWVLFNEKWGQYDQERLTKWMKDFDPSRIVNGHSGEYLYVNDQLRSPSPNAYVNADMTDVHSYPQPMNAIKMQGKAQVCGEFGGIGVFIPDHQWSDDAAWGYINEKPADLKAKYAAMNVKLVELEKEGMSGSIYTQPFDVETEQNGLMTYDREVIKVPFAELRKIHAGLNPEIGLPNWLAMTGNVTAKDADLTDPMELYKQAQTAAGANPKAEVLKKLIQMAGQNGDEAGKNKYVGLYLQGLKQPLNEEDVKMVARVTTKTTDPGYQFMNDNADAFKKVLGDRKFITSQMNMIFKGEFEPMMKEGKTWAEIGERAKTFGAPGEEMFLRTRAIGYFNEKKWAEFVPAAKEYLEKYGQNISAQEKAGFEQAIQQNQK